MGYVLPRWMTFWVYGFLALIVSWAATGCRIRNYVLNPPGPGSNYTVANYNTTPKDLIFCADVNDTATPPNVKRTCQPSAVANIPTMIANTMSDPVALVKDKTSGLYFLVNPTNTAYAIQVLDDENGNLPTALQGTDPAPFWANDTTCTSSLNLYDQGSYSKTTNRIAVEFQMYQDFTGTCTATLTRIKKCYLSSGDCGEATPAANASDQTKIIALLQPYLDAKALTQDEIPRIVQLIYQAEYE